MSVYKRKVCLSTWVKHAHRNTKCSLLLLMLVLTLILLLILVDCKTHVNISVTHDANLGARSSLFITNTTANRNCDADICRNSSIYTSMDVSNTKAIQLSS